MKTWQSVLLAAGAMIIFVFVVVGAVLAVIYFQHAGRVERIRDRRHW